MRLLIVEDSEDDAHLLYSELARSGDGVSYTRVASAVDMRAALREDEWDLVISDHSLPGFSSLEALDLLKESGKDIPFIIYSGEVSEHVAVAAMYSGAQDAIRKGNVARLLPAIERELHGAALRRAKRQADNVVHKLSNYDSLTGLPNRSLFLEHVGQALPRIGAAPDAFLFALDIDQLARVNNSFGYQAGDALIIEAARRLQTCIPDEDMVARCGSDEFAIFVQGTDTIDGYAERIRQAFSKPFMQDGTELVMTVSIGAAVASGDGNDAATLYMNAETAMYRAKKLGRNTWHQYADGMNAAESERFALETALRRAVERGELILEYEPRVKIETGEVAGVEALVRWQHPEFGLLPPARFIPLADETGLIAEIGEWALRSACRQARVWHDAGYPGLTVAVNVSAVQFWQPGMVHAVAKALRDSAIPPQWLELEITESALMRDVEATVAMLRTLKDMGVKIAIDDFGTGYSSLNYLRRFPIDTLKIDRTFTSDVTRDPTTAAIVRAIAELARSLRLTMVAEGVETPEQLEFFREQKCGLIQGFLLSGPRSAREISTLLAEGSPGWSAQLPLL